MTTPGEPVYQVEEEPQYSEPEVPMRNGRPWGIRKDLYEGLKTNMVSQKDAQDIAGEGVKEAKRINDILAEDFDGDLQVAWNATTTQIDEAQNLSIRSLSTSMALHENRMKWMRWTAHQQFWVGSVPVDNEWVHLEMFPSMAGLPPRPASVHITPKKGWRGKITMLARFGSGDVDIANWDHHVIDGSGKKVEFHAGASGWNYQSAVILISPLWGPSPREYVLVGGNDGGFIPNDDYHNYFEWNPLNWVNSSGDIQPNAAEFVNGITVMADRPIRVLTDFNDDYVLYGANMPILPSWLIAPVTGSEGVAVKFTEVR